MAVFVDISHNYPAEIVTEAFRAGAAANKRGPGFLNWCLTRMQGKLQDEADKPKEEDEGERQIAYLKSLGCIE